jgi:hypothetical protein
MEDLTPNAHRRMLIIACNVIDGMDAEATSVVGEAVMRWDRGIRSLIVLVKDR